jgi:hypothetical protein
MKAKGKLAVGKVRKAYKSRKGDMSPVRHMRRRRSYRPRRSYHRGFLNTGTIFKFVRIGAFLAPGLARGGAIYAAEKNPIRAVSEGLGIYAGWQDGQFNIGAALGAWTPFIVASAMTYGIPKITSLIRRI